MPVNPVYYLGGAYLGEERVEDLRRTPFAAFGQTEWALYFLQRYGGIDGAHHKTWAIDQAVRVLLGTRVEVWEATWSDGHREYRVRTGEPSVEYRKHAADAEAAEQPVDPGIAP